MIGIFDSGIGGLGIYLELKKLKPDVDVIYLADSANFPYGEKNETELGRITRQATQFLLGQGAETIVVACNSATVSVIEKLRQEFGGTKFVGIEPAIKLASNTNEENIGLMATARTVRSHDSQDLAGDKQIDKITDAELISTIENDYDKITDEFLRQKFQKFVDKNIHCVVLGCTHFYFIRERLQTIFPKVNFLEPAEHVARRVLAITDQEGSGKSSFYVSGDFANFQKFLLQIGIKNADIRKITPTVITG